MNPTWQAEFQNNQQWRFSGTHLFIFFFKIISVQKLLMFQDKFADFKNPIVLHIEIFNVNATSDIVLRVLTGLKYFNHYWSWKSNKGTIRNRGVNLYRNEPESPLNLATFPTNICIQLYLFIDHFEIKIKSINKKSFVVFHGALWWSTMWCSAVIYTLSLCSGMICGALGGIHCPISALSVICCSVASGLLISVLLDAQRISLGAIISLKT